MKNKRKSVNDSSNYRAIALSSPLAKLFDKIILQTHGDIFRTDDLQYGFKEHSSTTKCTFSLMETVNYFRKNNSNVCIMLLDATKAFDKVNYVKLFHQLIDRGLNLLVIQCLLYTYTHQTLNVSWNKCRSNYFSTSNGVKQGGVLSPILFSIYIDALLTRLKQSGFGCMVGHVYCGAFAYADDISLVAPSAYALKAMCDICSNYANEYDIKFNTSKCQLIKYDNCDDAPFHFNGIQVEYDRHGIHLGHAIGPDHNNFMITDITRNFIIHLNGILDNFGFCELYTKYQLFVSYCTSFYGTCLLDLQHKAVNVFYTTWRKALRRLFGLPRNTHCNILPILAGCLPIQSQLLNRYANFMHSSLHSSNPVVRVLAHMAVQGSGSVMSRNCNLLQQVYNINSYNVVNGGCSLFKSRAYLIYNAEMVDNVLVRVCFLRDTLRSRDATRRSLHPGAAHLQLLDFIIEYLCTS